jgi:hypothetical protein
MMRSQLSAPDHGRVTVDGEVRPPPVLEKGFNFQNEQWCFVSGQPATAAAVTARNRLAGLADHQDPVRTYHLLAGKPRNEPAPRFHSRGGHGMPSPGEGDQLSFERDIKPLFRTKDRDSMLRAFDLFDYADVVEHADAIVGFPVQRADAV